MKHRTEFKYDCARGMWDQYAVCSCGWRSTTYATFTYERRDVQPSEIKMERILHLLEIVLDRLDEREA